MTNTAFSVRVAGGGQANNPRLIPLALRIGFLRAPIRSALLLRCIALCIGSAALWGEATPSPALLVTDRANNALVIVDPKDRHVVASIPVGKGPHEIAVTPDGKLALVSNFEQDSNSISLIDLKAQKELHQYKFSFKARPNALAHVDGKFYFTAEDANSIGSYDPATNTVDAMIGVGQLTTHVLLYNAAARSFIVTSRGSSTVSFLESISMELFGRVRPAWSVTTVPGVIHNEAMDLSPDAKELWVSEFMGGKVAVLDVAARKVKENFDVPDLQSDRLKFTPDGKRVLLSDISSGNLVVLDAATRKEIKRVKVGNGLEGIQITPDGSTAYAVAPRDNAVVMVDLKTLEVTGHISIRNPLSAVWVP